MEILVKSFSKLSTAELYRILQLRSEVFVVEQDCVYQDLDGKDQNALHIIGVKNKEIIAYARILKPSVYFKNASIGRVLVADSARNKGYAHLILKESITKIEKKFTTSKITISAQTYLLNFYNSHGFKQVGAEYLEDGLPHYKMIKKV